VRLLPGEATLAILWRVAMSEVKEERERWIQELQRPTGESDRNWGTAVLLSFMFGYVGADRFYLGYVESAILKLVTLGGLGWWWLWDLIQLATGSLPDGDGYPLKRDIRLTPGLVVLVSLGVAGVVLLLISLAMSS
jgi:hypothetical protein